MKFARDLLPRIFPLPTHLQEVPDIRSKTECLLSQIVSLDKHFDSRPSDLTEQRNRSGVIRYAVVLAVVLRIELVQEA